MGILGSIATTGHFRFAQGQDRSLQMREREEHEASSLTEHESPGPRTSECTYILGSLTLCCAEAWSGEHGKSSSILQSEYTMATLELGEEQGPLGTEWPLGTNFLWLVV